MVSSPARGSVARMHLQNRVNHHAPVASSVVAFRRDSTSSQVFLAHTRAHCVLRVTDNSVSLGRVLFRSPGLRRRARACECAEAQKLVKLGRCSRTLMCRNLDRFDC